VQSAEKGFTLIEIAIVLVIVGLLVGFGASIIGPMQKRARRNEASQAVAAAKESLIGFAASIRNRLPVWGDNTPDTTSDEFCEVVSSKSDPWGKPLYYVFDNNLSMAVLSNDLCTRNTTNITVRECADAACGTYTDTPNVAFLIISGGPNYNNQTRNNQAVAAAVTVNVYPPEVGPVDNYNGDGNRAEPYDDIVTWVTLFDLKTKIACPNKTAETLVRLQADRDTLTGDAVLNTRLARWGNNAADYSPTDEFCEIAPYRSDAWDTAGAARPFLYLVDNQLFAANSLYTVNSTRITFNGTANIAFLIVSRGPDGTVQSTRNGSAIAASEEVNTAITVVQNTDDLIEAVTLAELKTKLHYSKYNMCSAGMTVRNNYGATLYYRVNGGACTAWNNAATINVTSPNAYTLFTAAGCATPCATPNMTYFQQKDVDINSNCLTAIDGGCLMNDP